MMKFALDRNDRRQGFTILEVMIALAVSLLMMLALARAFEVIGRQISQSQSQVELSSDLRDVSSRLRGELRDATASSYDPTSTTTPPDGYFMYHEGPMTNATTTLLGLADASTANRDFFESNRFGDVDDYLAFTASRDPSEPPFMGYIPLGVLAAHEVLEARVNRSDFSYDIPGYTVADSVRLVPFFSREAEIVYWTSPQWEHDSDTGELLYDGAGHPRFRDANNDLIPDRFNLHRRVLLINDGLNMTLSEINRANGGGPTSLTNVSCVPFLDASGSRQVVRPMSASNWPTSEPFGTLESAGNANFDYFNGETSDYVTAPGVWGAGIRDVAPNWLVGMARLQQVMDLSVARRSRDDVPAATSIDSSNPYGQPSLFVSANSLTDLIRPENRFAHVRIPEPLLSSGGTAPYGVGSSMPVLALSPPHPFMVRGESIANHSPLPPSPLLRYVSRNLPAQADPDGRAAASAGGDDTLADNDLSLRYGRFTMVGHLRPEFNLQDRIVGPNATASGVAYSQVNRGGADIIATDVLGFDIRVFDPLVSNFVYVGADGVEGGLGDDDGNDRFAEDGTFDPNDLGFIGSDDELISINDLTARRILVGYPDTPHPDVPDWTPPVGAGDFVDLGFLRRAGHPIGGLTGVGPGAIPPSLTTVLSGADRSVIPPVGLYFPLGLQSSGRLVIRQRADFDEVHSFFQPTFDSGVGRAGQNQYSGDRFDQEGVMLSAAIGPNAQLVDAFYTEKKIVEDGSVALANPPVSYRNWSNFEAVPGSAAPPSRDPATGRVLSQPTPIEVTPPFDFDPSAIQVEIRLFDTDAQAIRQQSIIESL